MLMLILFLPFGQMQVPVVCKQSALFWQLHSNSQFSPYFPGEQTFEHLAKYNSFNENENKIA